VESFAAALPGQRLQGEAVVVEASVAMTRTLRCAPFLRAVLRDRAGRCLPAKRWDHGEPPPAAGDVVLFAGCLQLHEGSRQLVLDSIRPLGPADPTEWALAAAMPLELRAERVRAAIDGIGSGDLACLVRWVFDQPGVLERFLLAPAAKRYHSALVGGLAVHTLKVHDIVFDLAQHADSPVDADLLRAGALVHDIGKIDELEVSVATGLLPGYTAAHLQGHVALGVRRIVQAAVCCGLDDRPSVDLLVHLVVSHHGKPEWGAPVAPMTTEAILLHLADLSASRLEGAAELFAAAPPEAEWTEYSAIFGERLYAGV
jgi:3'-5' exoribonuclease